MKMKPQAQKEHRGVTNIQRRPTTVKHQAHKALEQKNNVSGATPSPDGDAEHNKQGAEDADPNEQGANEKSQET